MSEEQESAVSSGIKSWQLGAAVLYLMEGFPVSGFYLISTFSSLIPPLETLFFSLGFISSPSNVHWSWFICLFVLSLVWPLAFSFLWYNAYNRYCLTITISK